MVAKFHVSQDHVHMFESGTLLFGIMVLGSVPAGALSRQWAGVCCHCGGATVKGGIAVDLVVKGAATRT